MLFIDLIFVSKFGEQVLLTFKDDWPGSDQNNGNQDFEYWSQSVSVTFAVVTDKGSKCQRSYSNDVEIQTFKTISISLNKIKLKMRLQNYINAV